MAGFVVRPAQEHPLVDLAELWRYRHLYAVLVWRTLKVRYQQTVIGVAWAVLQPLLLAFVFTVIFGLLVGVPTDGNQPYPALRSAGCWSGSSLRMRSSRPPRAWWRMPIW